MSLSPRGRVAVVAAVAAAVWAAVTTIVGAAATPGYSHVADYMSELGANGAPAGALVSLAGFLPVGLLALVALMASGKGQPVLQAARLWLLSLPLAYLGAAFSRCDEGCSGASTSQTLHNLFGLLGYLGGAAALGSAALWFFRQQRDRTGLAMIFLAIAILATLTSFGTPYQGFAQRISEVILFGFLIFLVAERSR